MTRDLLRLTAGALLSHRLRSGLSMLGIAIGIGSVLLLTAVGEGTRGYVLQQFTQFGTNVLGVHPGKVETSGMPSPLGGGARKLTIDDAEAIARLPHVERVVPVALGQAAVASGGRSRSVFIYGVTAEALEVWKVGVRQGVFLPGGDPRRGAAVTVLGPRLARELFGDASPLGRTVRVADARLRVIGVMAPRGRLLGMDMDDSAYVPVATALRLFNAEELNEIDVTFTHERLTDEVSAAVRRTLMARHRGKEDFTIVTQAAMLDVLGDVLGMVTAAMGAIGAISLLVGAIGILTIMWIAVSERTDEIGLLRALGATARQVQVLFLLEATLLALGGGVLGTAGGLLISWGLRALLPGVPLVTPPLFLVAAVVVSLAVGLAAGVFPARRAARLDPIEALRAE